VRWRADPTTFIERVLHDPETGQPFVLLPAEGQFLEHAFKTTMAGCSTPSKYLVRRRRAVRPASRLSTC
jgi:hypothetical protein